MLQIPEMFKILLLLLNAGTVLKSHSFKMCYSF